MAVERITKVFGGAAAAAKFGSTAYQMYKDGKKTMGPTACPWCHRLIPQDLLDEHLLSHKKEHRACERAVAGGKRAVKEAYKYKEHARRSTARSKE